MKKRLRDLTLFPKPTINKMSLANLKRTARLKPYKDIIESLGDGNADGVRFFSDIRNNKALFYLAEHCPMVFQKGYYSRTIVEVYRRLVIPEELEKAIIEKCVEFS